MRRLLRAPLLHFLVIGGTMLGVRLWRDPGVAPRPRVVLGAADLARLREAWTEEHGAPPGPVAMDALVHEAVDDEILYREALARRFDRQDAAVRERLVRLGGFVGEETGGDREALEREARRLGLERGDLVIRRHLVAMMQLAAGRLGAADMPLEDDLAAYLARHADAFAEPARVEFTHVYLSQDARGPTAGRDAAALLEELRGSGRDAGVGRGEPFIHGADFTGSPAAVARAFGGGFADALEELPLGRWGGPVRSSYGWHLVWLRAREAARVPALAEVRGRVLHAWLREKKEERVRETMDALRARYDVETAR